MKARSGLAPVSKTPTETQVTVLSLEVVILPHEWVLRSLIANV